MRAMVAAAKPLHSLRAGRSAKCLPQISYFNPHNYHRKWALLPSDPTVQTEVRFIQLAPSTARPRGRAAGSRICALHRHKAIRNSAAQNSVKRGPSTPVRSNPETASCRSPRSVCNGSSTAAERSRNSPCLGLNVKSHGLLFILKFNSITQKASGSANGMDNLLHESPLVKSTLRSFLSVSSQVKAR